MQPWELTIPSQNSTDPIPWDALGHSWAELNRSLQRDRSSLHQRACELFGSLADQRKASLLARARSGLPRPSAGAKDHTERLLAWALSRYTTRSVQYDATFTKQIRNLAPAWFHPEASNAELFVATVHRTLDAEARARNQRNAARTSVIRALTTARTAGLRYRSIIALAQNTITAKAAEKLYAALRSRTHTAVRRGDVDVSHTPIAQLNLATLAKLNRRRLERLKILAQAVFLALDIDKKREDQLVAALAATRHAIVVAKRAGIPYSMLVTRTINEVTLRSRVFCARRRAAACTVSRRAA
jgi:hypothetical protein